MTPPGAEPGGDRDNPRAYLAFGGYSLNILSSALLTISAFLSALSLAVSVPTPRHTRLSVLASHRSTANVPWIHVLTDAVPPPP
jgi:hypothetical protein